MLRLRGFALLLLTCLLYSNITFSQAANTDSSATFKTIIPGEQYEASKWHQRIWGSNYRNLWTTPTTVKILYLDTAYGGLQPSGIGNSGHANILYLHNAANNFYSISTINNPATDILPYDYQRTIVENKFIDEGSITNPYALLTIPTLAKAAHTFYTTPTYVYLPKQASLNIYNQVYGDNLYVLQQGLINSNAGKQITTYQLLNTLNACTNCTIDQQAFIKERLFAMFLNDWNGDEEQWLWSAVKKDGKIFFTPLPQSHEKAYTDYNGALTKIILSTSGLGFTEPFGDNINNINLFNGAEKDLDRRLLNQATLTDWQQAANNLQQALTDETIENAVHKFPGEIYKLVGDATIEKLKSRRDHIKEWATAYYNFLAKEVEIPGSANADKFTVQQLNDSETVVHVYDLNKDTIKDKQPYYARTFYSSETKEIRLFGLSGNNKLIVDSSSFSPVQIKFISASAGDSVITSAKQKNIIVYSEDNIYTNRTIKIIDDTTHRSYAYDWFTYNTKGFVPFAFYSNEDRLFVSLGYGVKRSKWGKSPFASAQAFNVHFSLMENAFSFTYRALFPKLFAHTDLSIYANYDDVRWTYFFGLGNDTKYPVAATLKYYTMRTRQYIAQPELFKTFGNHTFSVFATMQGYRIIDDSARFLNKVYNPDNSLYKWNSFAGGGVSYTFQKLNDILLPTKGIYFNAVASAAQNIHQPASYYYRYTTAMHVYIPLTAKFSLGLRAGAATVTGNPEFYQYNSIGGITFRSLVWDRYWGKTSFYNTNDLRFITPWRMKFYNGKIGFLAYVDNGRVWMPGETSTTWHTGVGGGMIFVPFNFLYADITYGFSGKENTITARITTYIDRR